MQISTSFVQDKRHMSKSERFVPVQPSQIAEVLADHGLRLGHLLTSKARAPERAHHQTSIARYVADDSRDLARVVGEGSTLDLLVRAPHLTGCIELRLGFFRGTCANQWNAGKLLEAVRIRHTGNCLETLSRAIPALVARRTELLGQIETMAARDVTGAELAELARRVADIRLGEVHEGFGREVRYSDLLTVRRPQDSRSDMFTVANVLQENALRFGVRYDLTHPEQATRHMTTRRIVETTASAVEMTGSIWEAASAILAA